MSDATAPVTAFNVRQAAFIVGVPQSTMWKWARDEITGFGFEIPVTRVAVLHHRSRKKSEPPPRTRRTSRIMIPADAVNTLRQIFKEAQITRRGPWTQKEMVALKTVASRYRVSKAILPDLGSH